VTCETDTDTNTNTQLSNNQVLNIMSGAEYYTGGHTMDTNTTYTGDKGVTLEGTEFVADTSYMQKRISSSCAAGSSIRAISSTGAVTCETDDSGSSGGATAGPGSGSCTTSNTGEFRYRDYCATDWQRSTRLEICMRTGTNSYAWSVLKTNTFTDTSCCEAPNTLWYCIGGDWCSLDPPFDCFGGGGEIPK